MSDTDKRVVEAARVYMAAARRGEPPRAAVARRFNVSTATASRIVAQARDSGFLPKAAPGSSPRVNPKVLAVARALGVHPEHLLAAVLEHADGDLRVREPVA